MAYQTQQGIWIPRPVTWANLGPGKGNGGLINADGEKYTWILQAPKAGTLDKFECRLGTITQCTNGLTWSFQDLNAGWPDGVKDEYRTGVAPTQNDWNVPGLITDNGGDGGNKRTVTQGEVLACVVEFTTFDAGDSVYFSYSTDRSYDNLRHGFGLYTASWANLTDLGNFALKYDDGSYAADVTTIPQKTSGAETFNNTDTPDEVGNIFQFPFPCKVRRLAACIKFDGTSSDFDLVLYDSDGSTPLATLSVDATNERTGQFFWIARTCTSDQTLAKDTNYRITVKPSSANDVSLGLVDVNANAILDAYPGANTNVYKTAQVDGGGFSQTNTRIMQVAMEIIALDDATGGGAASSQLVGGGLIS